MNNTLRLLPSILLIPLLLISQIGLSQAPEGVNFQAVARDGSGNILANENLTVRMTIKEGGPAGTTVYQETHNSSTNDFGLFDLVVGQGSVLTGTFSNISWGSNSHFLQVEVDDGSGFVNLGTSQFVSVPYALYAKEAGNAGTSYNAGAGIDISGNTITNTGDTDASDDITSSSNAGGDVSGNFNNLTVVGIQGRSVSSAAPGNGQVLKWNGSAWAPANDVGGGSGDNWGSQVVQSNSTLTGDGTNANPLGVNGDLTDDQTLSISGNNLSISNGNTVSLPSGGSSVWQTSGSDIYYNNGRVGIGTSSPGESLDIVSATNTGDDIYLETPYPFLIVNNTDVNGNSGIKFEEQGSFGGWIAHDGSEDAIYISGENSASAQPNIVVTSNGEVGVGTSTPDNQLSVDGDANVIGDLGIGATNPSYKLEVNEDMSGFGTSVMVNFSPTNIQTNNDVLEIDAETGAPDDFQFVEFQRGSEIEFQVIGNGSVIIGDSDPQEELHVVQQESVGEGTTSEAIRIEKGSDFSSGVGNQWGLGIGASTNNFKFYYNSGGFAMADISSSTGAYNQISDRSVKEDIASPSPVLSKVMQLTPKRYYYKSDEQRDEKAYGFIAQDVEKIFPGFVSNLDGGIKGIAYDNFAVLSIQAIQEQQIQMEKLKDENQQLQSELDDLKKRVDQLEK